MEEAKTVLRSRSPGQEKPVVVSGWLSRALFQPDADVVMDALLSGEVDPMEDPWSNLACGRLPPA